MKILSDCLANKLTNSSSLQLKTISSIIIPLLFLAFCSKQAFSSLEEIHLPQGFKIEVFASDLGTPRFMAFSPDGVLFATIIGEGKVVALPDKNKDGKADRAITFVKGLNHPHGIA